MGGAYGGFSDFDSHSGAPGAFCTARQPEHAACLVSLPASHLICVLCSLQACTHTSHTGTPTCCARSRCVTAPYPSASITLGARAPPAALRWAARHGHAFLGALGGAVTTVPHLFCRLKRARSRKLARESQHRTCILRRCCQNPLQAYDGTPDFLRTLELDNDALTKAIIGTIGDIDSYQLPDSKVRRLSSFLSLNLFAFGLQLVGDACTLAALLLAPVCSMQHAAFFSSRAALIGKSAEVGTNSEVGFRSSSQGYTAFMRHVLGISDEERQQRREQVLSTTIKDFRCASLSCDQGLHWIFQIAGRRA